jgi:hypothetical protein
MKALLTRLRHVWRNANNRVRQGTPRERLLVAALALVGVLLVFSADVRLLRSGVAAWRDVSARTAKAEMLRANAPAIDLMLAEKSRQLTGRNRSAAEVLAAVDTLARECGLNAEAATPRTEKPGRLILHRVKLNLRAPSLRQLMDFDDRLHQRGDGIAVERVLLENRGDSTELAATYDLVACQPSE